MGVLGRPPIATPDGFEDAFLEHGWEAKDMLGMDTPRFKRALVELGGDELKRRRRNYVLGRRLSSLKPTLKGV
jgi:hypothetical protein